MDLKWSHGGYRLYRRRTFPQNEVAALLGTQGNSWGVLWNR